MPPHALQTELDYCLTDCLPTELWSESLNTPLTASAEFFDTLNVKDENGSRKDGGVGKTYGTLTVPDGAVEWEVKLRSYSLDEKTTDQNKTDQGPVSNPKYTNPKVCVPPSIRSFIPPFSLCSLLSLLINVMDFRDIFHLCKLLSSPCTVIGLRHSLQLFGLSRNTFVTDPFSHSTDRFPFNRLTSIFMRLSCY